MTQGMFTVYVGLLMFASGLCLGLAIASNIDVSTMKQQAIDHGAAYYHPETGAFTWRESEK